MLTKIKTNIANVTTNTANITTLQSSVSDHGKRLSTAETEISNLDVRFDQFVAPTGQAPNPQEILDARVINGVTYTNLHDAIETPVTDLKADLALKNGKINLTWSDGYYLRSSDGLGGYASNFAMTKYVPIEQDELYFVNTYANGNGEAAVCFYDSSKAYLNKYLQASGLISFHAPADGYLRISTRKAEISTADAFFARMFMPDRDLSLRRLQISFISGRYLVKSSGATGADSNYYYTPDYYEVKAGQRLFMNLFVTNSDSAAAVCFYDTSKSFISGHACENLQTWIEAPQDGYARFCSRKTISMSDAFVLNSIGEVEEIKIVSGIGAMSENILNVQKTDTTAKSFFEHGNESASETAKSFQPSMPKQEQKYTGEVTPTKRYMAIGFDDFRDSDFSAIIPMFEKYNGKGTFNRIIRTIPVSNADRKKLNNVLFGNHEMGDHTILHYAFPYCDALFNGQDPSNPDGSQVPYPTNAMFREDAGNGRNVFNALLTSNVSLEGYSVESTWADLTDEQCQGIREHYSAMKNTTLCTILDTLSNTYLGTTGSSDGSWDSYTGKYTGGIFTGCATSENHEIWERILQIINLYYKDVFGYNNDILCWSYPGGDNFGLGIVYGDHKYYDAAHTKLYNMNARFESSLYTDELGDAKSRSFTDVLREYGYRYTHDYNYAGRRDSVELYAMSKQFIINAHLSRRDGISYPTNRTINYNTIASAYPSAFFTSGKTKAAQMYDDGGEFYKFIEALRHDTSNGLVHGEVIDSYDSYSEKVFFDNALKFCSKAGIEIVTKAEAYDVCFNHYVNSGNLIYNPLLRNSVKEFIGDADNTPDNPDGYVGSCSVEKVDGVPVLSTSGDTVYLHYGVPYGNIKYKADVKGTGTIDVYLIRNISRASLANNMLDRLEHLTITNTEFDEVGFTNIIPDEDASEWNQACEELSNKIMGLKFVYSSGLQIKNIRLEMV